MSKEMGGDGKEKSFPRKKRKQTEKRDRPERDKEGEAPRTADSFPFFAFNRFSNARSAINLIARTTLIVITHREKKQLYHY